MQAKQWEDNIREALDKIPILKDNRLILSASKLLMKVAQQQASAVWRSFRLMARLMLCCLMQRFSLCHRIFKEPYNIVLDPSLGPSGALRSRLYKEFGRGGGQTHQKRRESCGPEGF